MGRLLAVRLLCVCVLAGGAAAQNAKQDTKSVSADLAKALAAEWMDPARVLHCLTAMRLYTGEFPSSDEISRALEEVRKGLGSREYEFAGKVSSVPKLLYVATQRPVDKNNPKAVDALFKHASDEIQRAFHNDSVVGALDSNVNTQVKLNNNERSIYELLQLTFDYHAALWPAAVATESALKVMELYRTCYSLDPARLLKLVSDCFQ
jgi:hypothetical protein